MSDIAKSRIANYNRNSGKMELIKADIDEAINEIQEPITKSGDIWILGRHRLMCRR